MSRVSVIGLGYVGLPLAMLAAKKGHIVTGIDLDEHKVSLINNHEDPLNDEYVKERIRNTTLRASTKPTAIKESDFVIICVPTPVKNDYHPDLETVKSAVKTAAKHLKKGAVLIVESTINPGVCDEIVIPLAEEVSSMKINKDFYVSHCPERINPGDKDWSVDNIPRVAGSSNEEGLRLTIDFYESILDSHVKAMGSLKEAEACKVVENSFRDINIAFVNELAKSFTKMGISVKNVIDGAATKPFAFMPHYPSVGVGGHCIPVDPYYLIEYARGYGFEHEFLSLARSINNSMPEFTVDQLIDGLNEAGMTLKGTNVGVLGLSYKPNVADDRESPSYKVIKIVEAKGAKVSVFDPYFPDKSTDKGLDDLLRNSDALILTTSHKEFLNIDFKELDIKVLVDGKNCLDQELVVNLPYIYKGIGV